MTPKFFGSAKSVPVGTGAGARGAVGALDGGTGCGGMAIGAGALVVADVGARSVVTGVSGRADGGEISLALGRVARFRGLLFAGFAEPADAAAAAGRGFPSDASMRAMLASTLASSRLNQSVKAVESERLRLDLVRAPLLDMVVERFSSAARSPE
jgi:hypothetical protein